MQKHERQAMKEMDKELRAWHRNRTVRVFPWTMGASILGVVAYVDLLEWLPEEPQVLWRLQLREVEGGLALETLRMGYGDEAFWRAVGRQGQGGTPVVADVAVFRKVVA